LIKEYDLPVKVIQVSDRVNSREMNQAVDLAKAVGADTISINPPLIYNVKTFKFIEKNLKHYKRHNPDIKFSIINPPKQNLLFVAKYYFSEIVDIIKKYKAYLALDIANLDEDTLDRKFLRKISNFVPYISVVYLSDKTKTDIPHVPLGE
jgi:sugar phosphate isomerase/epimerase